MRKWRSRKQGGEGTVVSPPNTGAINYLNYQFFTKKCNILGNRRLKRGIRKKVNLKRLHGSVLSYGRKTWTM